MNNNRVRIPEGITSLTAAEYRSYMEKEPLFPCDKAHVKPDVEMILPGNDVQVICKKYGLSLAYYFDVNPYPSPRMTRSDQWRTGDKQRNSVKKYFAFRDQFKRECERHDYSLSKILNVCIIVPFPKSYSYKKRDDLRYEYHQLRPDRDNYLKAIQDSFAGDDGFVCDGRTLKIWGNKGGILIFN